jgi:hypothetical protein
MLLSDRSREAIPELQQALRMDPALAPAHLWLSIAYRACGMQTQAEEEARAFASTPTGAANPETIAYIAALDALAGDRARAEEAMLKLASKEATGVTASWMWFELLQGNLAKAAYWAEKAAEQRNPTILYHARGPLLKPLRESQFWPRPAKLMNLP